MSNSQDVQEVKARADIVQVISRYVKLKKSSRNYLGLCPFHGEKTPSFNVNPALGIYKCFGCGVHGDVITFVEEIEHLEFPQALEKLAQEFGVTLHTNDDPAAKMATRLRAAYVVAADLYHYILTKHDNGKEALAYAIKNRKLTEKTIEEYKIGYAPKDKHLLQDMLAKKGFTKEEIEMAGFINEKGYDKFTDRLMFPIFDASGHVVAFSGRVMRKDDIRPKYINSPETVLYKKRFLLFGLYHAKKYIAEQDLAIVCEGQIDTIVSQQAGVFPIVAPLGTALTDTQVGLLGRYSKNIVFCFDNDTAGQKSILRGVQIALMQDMRPFVITLPPDVKDIDELVQKRPDDWKDRATHPIDFFDLQITQLKQLMKKDVPQFEKQLQEILTIVSVAPELKQGIIAKQFSDALGLAEQGLLSAIRKAIPMTYVREEVKQKQSAQTTAEYILSIIMAFPLITLLMGKPETAVTFFGSGDQQQVYTLLSAFALEHANIITSVLDKKTKKLSVSWDTVYTRFTNELLTSYTNYITKVQQENPHLLPILEQIGFSEQASNIVITDDILDDFFNAWVRLKSNVMKTKLEVLRRRLSSAEVSQNEGEIEQIQAEIFAQMESLKKIEKKVK